MGKCNIIAEHNYSKRTEGEFIGQEIQHNAHIAQEFDPFIAEEYSQTYTYDIQPFRMMMITPILKSLYQVHISKF